MKSTILRSWLATLVIVFMVLFGACQKAKTADSSAPQPEPAPRVDDEKNPLAVSIAIPFSSNKERVLYFTKLHFPVLISNHSDQPQKIWKDWNSWGYYALSFEMTDADGKSWKLTKNMPHAWSMNYPAYWIIPPGESLVLDVNLADSKEWQPFPKPEDFPATLTMRAIFEISPDAQSQKLSAWTGRAVSKAEKYVVYGPR